jgi:hypothetical protein
VPRCGCIIRRAAVLDACQHTDAALAGLGAARRARGGAAAQPRVQTGHVVAVTAAENAIVVVNSGALRRGPAACVRSVARGAHVELLCVLPLARARTWQIAHSITATLMRPACRAGRGSAACPPHAPCVGAAGWCVCKGANARYCVCAPMADETNPCS